MNEPRPGVLSMRWSKAQKYCGQGSLGDRIGTPGDVIYVRGDGCPKPDGHLLHLFACVARAKVLPQDPEPKSFLEELHARGYDLTTLKFSIRKRKE